VNIIVKGTTTGTTTDEKGAFEIKADKPTLFLVFTHIGYTTALNEFKSENNAAVITMYKGAQDLSAVMVTVPDGKQNTEIKPFPYVLVDGVPVDEGTFKSLDPEKMESVSVLKDENATSLYGEKGKNGVILIVTKKGIPSEEAKVAANQKSGDKPIFTVVEDMPLFPGGETERNRFFSNNLRVPAENMEGTVYVSFIVKDDGSVADAKILRGLGKSYDEEVLRVINLMPKWLPGRQNGEAVAVMFNMPVKFAKK
jgi:TonB family protein